jgi:hypothetical protein
VILEVSQELRRLTISQDGFVFLIVIFAFSVPDRDDGLVVFVYNREGKCVRGCI